MRPRCSRSRPIREVTRWFSWGPYTDARAAARPTSSAAPAQRERGEQLDLLVVHRELGPAGITGLSEFSLRDGRCMVGTWFGRDFWGTGANRESKAIMMRLAFDVLGMHRLGSYSNPANERSTRALHGVGFAHEGVLRALAQARRGVARRQRLRPAAGRLGRRARSRRCRSRSRASRRRRSCRLAAAGVPAEAAHRAPDAERRPQREDGDVREQVARGRRRSRARPEAR